MDTQMINEATKRANDIAPLPAETPGRAAGHAAIAAWLIGIVFYALRDLDVWVPMVVAVALSAFVAFSDCRMKWNRHLDEYRRAVDYLKFMKEKGGA